MHPMIIASLGLNIAVLVPVCFGLASRTNWAAAAWGRATPACGILLSVYLTILICSVGMLLSPVPAMISGLLFMQVVYKFTTPFTVGSITNPVVLSNLAIAAVHCVTLATIWDVASL